jgi:hypothetical protein
MKVGDRVRRIGSAWEDYPYGFETEVTQIDPDGKVWTVSKSGRALWGKVSDWEVISAAETDVVSPTPATVTELLQELHIKETTPLRVQILHEGARLTHGARDQEYGPPAVNMAAAGALKATFREYIARPISPAELEAIDMALTKLARIATGAPKQDTYVDAATYIAIAGEIALTPPRPSERYTAGVSIPADNPTNWPD